MARSRIYEEPTRINIILEKSDHEFGKRMARQHRMRGGFSEFLGCLIRAERKRKGRQLAAEVRRKDTTA